MGFSSIDIMESVGNRPRIRDHGPKEQGESAYKIWETCPAFVRPRKRILYRTRIDDTDFLSFSVLIRLIAAYEYSIIPRNRMLFDDLGGRRGGTRNERNVRPFTQREPPSSSVSPLLFLPRRVQFTAVTRFLFVEKR